MRKTEYHDLMKEYENPILHTCDIQVGDYLVIDKPERPEGFCESAWGVLYPFIKDLFDGKEDFFDGWMKNKKSAMLSCNDGFRPVSFYIEVIEE